jgi:CHASE2 domain-containing sensor protein
LFVGFLLLTFTRRMFSRASVILILILCLHVLSWPVICSTHGRWDPGIRIGYFVWLSAYILQTFTCIKYRKTSGPAR